MVAPEEITKHHEWDGRNNDDIWVGGRLAPEPVVIVEYDPEWPVVHVAVADRIGAALGEAVLALDHVALVIREPGWHEHRVLKGDDPRVNLHVFSPDCPETIRHLMFRDWLRAHPDDAAQYLDAKIEAAAAATAARAHVMDYNRLKEAVIHEIYARMFAAHGLL